MLTRDERRALLFLAGTAALGGAVRAVRAGTDAPPGAALIAPELAAGDVVAQAARAQRALAMARPLEPGSRVDLDQADALEIERLPGIGPQLARRIVEERTASGPFGSLAGLGRVRGVGPALMAGMVHQASFGGVPAVAASGAQDPAGSRAPRAKPKPAPALAVQGPAQGTGPAIATMPPPAPPQRLGGFTIVAPRARRTGSVRAAPAVRVACPALPLSVNVASAAELACLPGIGPVIAQQIVTWRTAHGAFAQVSDLEQVPGIGPVKFQRLLPYVRAP
jgi:competence ComEA-like helix-hairpin-helix protein